VKHISKQSGGTVRSLVVIVVANHLHGGDDRQEPVTWQFRSSAGPTTPPSIQFWNFDQNSSQLAIRKPHNQAFISSHKMPNNKRKTAKTIKGKDSVHPSSRKAGQLDRIQLRAVKLQRAATKRKGETKSKCEQSVHLSRSAR
jgi:hypothetical protein